MAGKIRKKTIMGDIDCDEEGICKECSDNHSDYRINMAKIYERLDNIVEKIDKNSSEHKDIMNAFIKHVDDAELKFAEKADKQDVKDIRTLVYAIFGTAALLGLGFILWYIQQK